MSAVAEQVERPELPL